MNSGSKFDSGGSRFELGSIRRRVLSVPTLLSVGIGVLIIGFLLWRVLDFDWSVFLSQIRGLDLRVYVLAGGMYYLSFWFRGLRWRSLYISVVSRSSSDVSEEETSAPSVWTMSGLILGGWFVNSVMFFRLGDAYRSWALSDRSGIGVSVSLGTVFAERVQDTVIVLGLMAVSAVWALQVDGFAGSAAIVDATVIAIAVAAGLALVLLLVLGLMGRFGEGISSRLPSGVRDQYLRFQSGTLDSFSSVRLPWQTLLGVVGWMMEIVSFYFVVRALGFEMDLSIAVFVTLVHTILTALPIPGGLGVVETVLVGLLLATGFDDTDAFTLIFLTRAIMWFSIVVIGGLVFVYMSLNRGGRGRKAETDVSASSND